MGEDTKRSEKLKIARHDINKPMPYEECLTIVREIIEMYNKMATQIREER